MEEECCEKHTKELHHHIQHMIEQYKRSAGGGHHWSLPERLSCAQVDAILAHTGRWSHYDGNHSFVPLMWENDRTPNLSCAGCTKGILTFLIEDAYCIVVIDEPLSQKKNNPRS